MPVSIASLDSLAPAAMEALLNGLWQGLVLAALVWLVLRRLRPGFAAARCWIWYAVLLALFVLPLVHLSGLVPLADLADAVNASDPAEAALPAGSAPALPAMAGAPARLLSVPPPSPRAFRLFLLAWGLASAALGLRLLRGLVCLHRLKSQARPAPAPLDAWARRWLAACAPLRAPRLLASDRVALPLAAGLARPAILFPESLVSRLSAEEAHGIWLHELAHIRRWDDWTHLGQRLIESVLFFHPAVWLIGRRLRLERELACDQWVVARTGAARSYAASLVKLLELVSPAPPPLAAQAPAPPEQPAPQPAPQPEPAPAPAAEAQPPAPPAEEQIHKLVAEIQAQVRSQIQPNVEQIRKLSAEIAAKVRSEIDPSVRQINEQIERQLPSSESSSTTI